MLIILISFGSILELSSIFELNHDLRISKWMLCVCVCLCTYMLLYVYGMCFVCWWVLTYKQERKDMHSHVRTATIVESNCFVPPLYIAVYVWWWLARETYSFISLVLYTSRSIHLEWTRKSYKWIRAPLTVSALTGWVYFLPVSLQQDCLTIGLHV